MIHKVFVKHLGSLVLMTIVNKFYVHVYEDRVEDKA
jgi:hypothetical protein